PSVCQSLRQCSAQRSFCRGQVPVRRGRSQLFCELTSRSQIEDQRHGLLPIRRDLQHRWAAESAMSDQHFFPKERADAVVIVNQGGDYFRGHTSKIAIVLPVFGVERQRNQPRTALLQGNSKLPRQV